MLIHISQIQFKESNLKNFESIHENFTKYLICQKKKNLSIVNIFWPFSIAIIIKFIDIFSLLLFITTLTKLYFILSDYSCSLWTSNVPRQGCLYLSVNHCCFYSIFFGTKLKLVIKWIDVKVKLIKKWKSVTKSDLTLFFCFRI